MIEQKYIDEVLDKVEMTEVAEDYGIALSLKDTVHGPAVPFTMRTRRRSVSIRPRTYGIVMVVTGAVMLSPLSWRRMALLSLWP